MKIEAHHHLIVFECSFVVKAKLSDDDRGALPQVVLPHAHVLLPSGQKTNTQNLKENTFFMSSTFAAFSWYFTCADRDGGRTL